VVVRAEHHRGPQDVGVREGLTHRRLAGRAGAGVLRSRVGRGSDAGKLHEAADAGVAGRLGDAAGAFDVHRLEGLRPALDGLADGVDAGGGALQGGRHRAGVADIGLHELHLADIAGKAQVLGQVGLPHRHPHAPAGLGQHPHHLAADEARAAEHRHQVLHRSRNSQALKAESAGIDEAVMRRNAGVVDGPHPFP
jgi:hypothetical protein